MQLRFSSVLSLSLSVLLLLQPDFLFTVLAAPLAQLVPTTAPWHSISLSDVPLQPHIAEVVSPPSLAGWFAFSPAPFTGTMFVNASCTGAPDEQCRKQMQVMLLNSMDDNYACSVSHTITDGGEKI